MNWKLTPAEPTPEMYKAARDWSAKKYGKPIGTDASDGCYKAMLSAAPDPLEDAELVERVARAICASQGLDPNMLVSEFYEGKPIYTTKQLVWEIYEDEANAAIMEMKGE